MNKGDGGKMVKFKKGGMNKTIDLKQFKIKLFFFNKIHKHARLRSTISLCCWQNRLTDMLKSMAAALLWTGWLSNFAVLIRP